MIEFKDLKDVSTIQDFENLLSKNFQESELGPTADELPSLIAKAEEHGLSAQKFSMLASRIQGERNLPGKGLKILEEMTHQENEKRGNK